MRIFFKIFAGFWLALLGVVVASVAVTVALGDNTPIGRWRSFTGQALAVYAQTAADTYELGGTVALNRYLKRIDTAAEMHTYLFDDSGELSSNPAPFAARYAAVKQFRGDRLFLNRPLSMWSTQACVGSSGRRYVLVCDIDRMSPLMSGPLLRVVSVVLVASLVCLLLARNFADPIVMLRRATSGLAEGRFSTRVDSAIVRRGDEIGDLGRDFDVMAARLEASVSAQRRLLADISHELRSPLARLSVAAGLVSRSADPETLKSVERIEREAERLNTLIGQLSMLSQMESDVFKPRFERVNLTEIARDVVADAHFEAASQGRSVTMDDDGAASDVIVNGDADLLRRAIENVVRNGVRYTAESTAVEVSIRREEVGNTSVAVVRVRDHGSGIAEGHLHEVFRPFYRVDYARDRQAGGVGLGLAIVEHSVRLHHGSVIASNSPSGGLVVEIRLPIGRPTPLS